MLTATIFAATGLLAQAFAGPLPNKVERRAADVPTQTPYGPPGSSGQLRGSKDLNGYSPSNPVSDKKGSTVIPPKDFSLAPGQKKSADLGLYLDLSNVKDPQPIRGSSKSPTDPGPQNKEIERQNSDLFAPPSSDAGGLPNIKWPTAPSHNRHGLKNSGWSRQENTQVLPVANAMAAVDMRLEPSAYRELHWHSANEWSYILNGSVRVAAVDEAGRTFTDDLQAGDVWFFPAGKPHTIQALEDGVEFLLVFDEGDFSDDATFLVSELFLRNPKSVLAKDLRVDTSAFDHLPSGELYIFPGTPAPTNNTKQNVTGPAGIIPNSNTYSFHWS